MKKKSEGTPLCLTFTADEPILLRDLLNQNELSKRAITAIKYSGGRIAVNSVERTVRWMLSAGDEVTVEFPPEQLADGLIAEPGYLAVLYEDEALLVIDKPAGQGTIPSRNQPSGTLANVVAGKYERDGHQATVHVVTRLDTDTSGVVCIAKNRHIHHLLSSQMQQTGIDRRYRALVSGILDGDDYRIEEPIGRKDGSIIERTVRPDGQYARTDVRVTGRYSLKGELFTAVELQLHTGRTHQIRVHMAHAGHPLLGDDLYGGPCALLSRQALHCARVSFIHPTERHQVTFQSSLPDDLAELLAAASLHQEE
ncbi:RluA family pseudouridine synthase [Sporosarcina sp. NCCP-2716]|uniref:RluA family pseudouridine synthase n=1 Tax=Sporosarcina sp. NCCP-2716 TaxID=2943679 RepID=UPI00283A8EBC|nr:RluA family pseudouridine synthase [Sporosarcina sp. NCCP-2716]